MGGPTLSPELRATLCGLVAESRRRNQTSLRGIRGSDGVTIGQAFALDRELDALERWALVDVRNEGTMAKTVEILEQAFTMCAAGS